MTAFAIVETHSLDGLSIKLDYDPALTVALIIKAKDNIVSPSFSLETLSGDASGA
ncbi:MAG: hypothetical protein AAF530_23720 [Pseudomonadota bacterium]